MNIDITQAFGEDGIDKDKFIALVKDSLDQRSFQELNDIKTQMSNDFLKGEEE